MQLFCLTVGLLLGSFINMAAWRIPRGQSIVRPRSHCIHCGRTLGPLDLIPVLSYLWLRGRCRTCGARIPIRYLLVELVCGALWLTASLTADTPGQIIISGLFASLLLLATIIDLEHLRIPDAVSLATLLLALLRWSLDGWPWRSLVLVVLIFTFTLLLSFYGFGGGDIKLASAMAWYLGWPDGALALFLAFLIGGLSGSVLLLTGLRSRRDSLPFGPFLAMGGWLALFWGPALLASYWRYATGVL